MISIGKALELLQQGARPVCSIEEVPLEQGLGRVLASPVISTVDVPPADNSSMDGYAVQTKNIKPEKTYRISQRISAGSPPAHLEENTVARIFTGAEIPAGADAVIIQENSNATKQGVSFKAVPADGDNIRRLGQDIAQGSEILKAGVRLRPQEIGLIASCGIESVQAYKKLRIALLGTGDELVEPGKSLQPGQIYNSNRYLLKSLCLQAGFEPIDMGTISDDLGATIEALNKAVQNADIVITTGGVSVGEEDHVKPAVEKLGQLDLWKVAIKPGKPLAFGNIAGTDFIGLPGNPSSVFTTFLILTLPRLQLLQGLNPSQVIPENLPALFERDPVRRREYLRARKTPKGVEIFPNQSSGVLSSACWGDGFAVQYEDTDIRKGQPLEFISYQHLLC